MDGQVLDFGVTGLLRYSNLLMYDRQTESWWQEFGGEAVVGNMAGKQLELLPMSLISWKEFRSAFPDGKVLSRDTGSKRPYGRTPYSYIEYDFWGVPYLYDGPSVDERLPVMARVVAVIVGEESLTVPFRVLMDARIVHYTLAGQDLVVFYKEGTSSPLDAPFIAQGWDVGAATVYDPNLEGRKLTFRSQGDANEIVDEQTGSTWNLLGQAISGPLEGRALTPIPHRSSQLWFSWVVYKPDTILYTGQ